MGKIIQAPRGNRLSCKNWQIEAPYRMIQNNLNPDVAEDPENLIVYGGKGKAARNWDCYNAILKNLEKLNQDETLLIQSGKPVGVLRTHETAPPSPPRSPEYVGPPVARIPLVLIRGKGRALEVASASWSRGELSDVADSRSPSRWCTRLCNHISSAFEHQPTR